MQAVQTLKNETLSPEKQAEWIGIAVGLGTKRQLLALPRAIEDELQNKLIFDFVYQLWQTEEQKRRRREKWLMPANLFLFGAMFLWSVYMVIVMLITSLNKIHSMMYPLLSLNSCLVGILTLKEHAEKKQRGLTFLLMNAPIALPCSVLIASLDFPECRHEIKLRLAKLLPGFHATDAPALDKHQQQVLLSELKFGLIKHTPLMGSVVADIDSIFLVGIIQYFEAELASDKPITRKITPLLTSFSRSKRTGDIGSPWEPVYQATERYLRSATPRR